MVHSGMPNLPEPSQQPRRLLRIDQVAEILDVSTGRAYELARAGLFPVVGLGRQVRVDPRSLDEFLQGGGQALPAPEHSATDSA